MRPDNEDDFIWSYAGFWWR